MAIKTSFVDTFDFTNFGATVVDQVTKNQFGVRLRLIEKVSGGIDNGNRVRVVNETTLLFDKNEQRARFLRNWRKRYLEAHEEASEDCENYLIELLGERPKPITIEDEARVELILSGTRGRITTPCDCDIHVGKVALGSDDVFFVWKGFLVTEWVSSVSAQEIQYISVFKPIDKYRTDVERYENRETLEISDIPYISWEQLPERSPHPFEIVG